MASSYNWAILRAVTLILFYIISLFYLDNGRFALQSYYIFTILFREILLPITLIYILLLPVLSKIVPIGSLYFNYNFSVKDIFYIWSAIFINLIIFINLFFKTFWGRARPNEIVEFGGEKIFSSWYQISDMCTANCSFVSGDAAVGFSLIVLYFVSF